MATPVLEIEEIVAALGETQLAWLAAEASAAVAALPQLPGGPAGSDVEAANEQLRTIEQVVLDPMRRELIATRRIGELAEGLGLSSTVELLLESEEGSQRVVLNSQGRLGALENFVDALDRTLGQARERVAVRGRRGQ